MENEFIMPARFDFWGLRFEVVCDVGDDFIKYSAEYA